MDITKYQNDHIKIFGRAQNNVGITQIWLGYSNHPQNDHFQLFWVIIASLFGIEGRPHKTNRLS